MWLFTAYSAYLCHVWQFEAKLADNTQTYCWYVYALNVGNMKTWQYCNILSSKIKFTQYYKLILTINLFYFGGAMINITCLFLHRV